MKIKLQQRGTLLNISNQNRNKSCDAVFRKTKTFSIPQEKLRNSLRMKNDSSQMQKYNLLPLLNDQKSTFFSSFKHGKSSILKEAYLQSREKRKSWKWQTLHSRMIYENMEKFIEMYSDKAFAKYSSYMKIILTVRTLLHDAKKSDLIILYW